MKVIQSAGGPLIGFNVEYLQRWRGSSGKDLTKEDSRFGTDYEAATYFAHSRHKPPSAVALMNEITPLGLLISMPIETSIIDEKKGSIYIAQVEYADPDWDFEAVSVRDFDRAMFLLSDKVYFSSASCRFILFDAAYEGCNVGDDCLFFDIDTGDHVLSAAEYQPDERTGLILYKIERC